MVDPGGVSGYSEAMETGKDGAAYRPSERRRGRRTYLWFEGVNTVSYVYVAGNLLTLLALRIGANGTLVGVLAAFAYVSYLFMPLAKGLVPSWGLVRTFGRSWFARYGFGALLILVPWLGSLGWETAALGILLTSNLLFHVFRGMGMVSLSPLSHALSAGKDRGEFLSRKTMLISLATIGAGLVLALFLGPGASWGVWGAFIGAGTVLGMVSSILILRIPEPRGGREGASTPFLVDLRAAWARAPFRRFIIAYGALMLSTSLARPFFLVYARQSLGFDDGTVLLLGVVGSIGAIAMGQLSRVAMDRLGAKPLLLVFSGAFLMSCLVLTVFPRLGGIAGLAFMAAMFFVSSLGAGGCDNASQAYFFGVVDSRRQLNMGLLFYLVTGGAGALGSGLGGMLLDLAGPALSGPVKGILAGYPVLQALAGTGDDLHWRIFFLISALAVLPALALATRLAPLGARDVREALTAIINPRELRAMNLMRRLDQPLTLGEERSVMGALPQLGSRLVMEQMAPRLESPLSSVRGQALLVLERVPLTDEVEDALVAHLESHAFGTAFRAARIIGQRCIRRGVPALRRCLSSGDHLLRAHAARALGDMEAREARQDLEDLGRNETDYLVLAYLVDALGRLGVRESLQVFLEILTRSDPPPFLRDEVLFGMAGILGFRDWLYPRYTTFLEDPAEAAALLADGLENPPASGRKQPRHPCGTGDAPVGRTSRNELPFGLLEALDDPSEWRTLFGTLAASPGCMDGFRREDGDIARELDRCLDHPAVREYPRFRFFCTAWVAWRCGGGGAD